MTTKIKETCESREPTNAAHSRYQPFPELPVLSIVNQ